MGLRLISGSGGGNRLCHNRGKDTLALRERRQHRICFVMLASGEPLHLKCENTPALAFRAATALAPLE